MGVPISNVTRRVVFAASGTGPYAFTFEILAAADIAVYRDDTLLTLTTDYTVTINTNGTGSVTLTAAPTGATQIAIVGNRTISRTTDFTTGGDFFANTLNNELDQQTIFAQQNAEGLARALQAPQTDPTTINMVLPKKADRAGKYLAFDANGNPAPGDTAVEVGQVAAIKDDIVAVSAIDDKVTTVAGISANVTTVAGISSAVSGVAAISSAVSGVNSNSTNINAVNSNKSNIDTVAGIAANVTTVAGISANVTTVAGIDQTDLADVADIAGDITTVAGIASDVAAVENISANVTTVAGISANVTTVAGISTAVSNVSSISSAVSGVNSNSTNINTVAGISSNVTTVAGISSDVTAVKNISSNVTTVAGISSNVTSVAGNSSNINTVAGNSTNINTVAGISSNVTTVAGISSAVSTVATNVADITNFNDVYQGPKSSNPSARNDSSALQSGDLYFNTAANEMRVYNGSAWQTTATLPDLVVEYEFTATAGQTSYTFTGGYRIGFVYVWVNGVMLSDADITASNGNTITFGTALNLNDEVRVITFKAVGSVTAADVSALPLAGGTMTGNITFNSGQTFPGTGDVAGQSSSVDSEIALFSGTGGKTIKRATTTGVLKASSGVIAAATAGTDYVEPGTATTFTAAQTFRAANAVRSEAASTQDAVVIAGRAGGTGSYAVTLTPTTLSANRTVTLADGNVTMVAGTTAVLGTAQSFSAAQRGTTSSLSSSSASIASDFAVANNFTHTFTENTTLANPSNLVAGQSGVIVFTQHASSPKTLAFGSYWKFPGGTAPSVTASNSAVDVLAYYVESTTRITARLISDVK